MAHDHGEVFAAPRLYDMARKLTSLGRSQNVDQRAAELLVPYAPTALLDVGCGTGALTMSLRRRHPDSEVIGVDPGEAMIEHARRKAVAQGLDIDYRTGHGQQLPVDDDAVDAVTISLALHHVPEDEVADVLTETLRVLRPGGVLLVVELAPKGRLVRLLSLHPRAQFARFVTALRDAGFTGIRSGRLTPRLLGYISGLAPTVDAAPRNTTSADADAGDATPSGTVPKEPAP